MLPLVFSPFFLGIGIPLCVQDKIWDAFSQADMSTTKVYGGTGLGLTVCKQVTSRQRDRQREREGVQRRQEWRDGSMHTLSDGLVRLVSCRCARVCATVGEPDGR